ncbi:CLUMA_CG007663, isoform A [Clunio marinus]|uniref:CLUMA_CG007663, isoform A n=1 Tax=Clunio marinus TaxID=568069 RepID=A0A1J1I1D9_9DIPT|nr:CLUMA_CG007663, isoform A [Clunio marinus]
MCCFVFMLIEDKCRNKKTCVLCAHLQQLNIYDTLGLRSRCFVVVDVILSCFKLIDHKKEEKYD